MTHFPQPHPERRAARVQLGGSVQAAIRSEDGERTRGKLQSISVTGGLLALGKPLDNGDFIEIAFQTRSGAVHGMAEMLNPTRELKEGCLQSRSGQSEHRRAQHETGDHLADHHGLAEETQDEAENAGASEDDDELQKQG